MRSHQTRRMNQFEAIVTLQLHNIGGNRLKLALNMKNIDYERADLVMGLYDCFSE